MAEELQTAVGLEPVVLRDGLIFGRGAEVDVLLADAAVSRRHFAVRAVGDGWVIEDLGSKSGSFLNGRLFEREELVYGDLLQAGAFVFRFDGTQLVHLVGGRGAELECRGLTKTANGNRILDGVSLRVGAGQFVGVIGPSGAGKSTLLDALCGLRPADSGEVRVDGEVLTAGSDLLRDVFGYVPQDDIVPLDLTVERALDFSARLRLPAGMPAGERRRLVRSIIDDLGLSERAGTRVGSLSGGQRKRVSVAAELLGRPRLLFLDEPTSGLDPAAEFSLMQLLRQLSTNGCTIVCTTHVMENAFLMDSLVVLAAGRLVFMGDAGAAKAHFGIERLSELHDRLADRSVEAWVAAKDGAGAGSSAGDHRDEAIPRAPSAERNRARPPRAWALPILLLREWAILCADWKNLAILLGQPVLIGVLVTWVSRDPALVLFFAYIATLWFGCGNAAQEIVKELPMFRRERLIGLGQHAYLLAKFLSLARITVVQSMLLYGTMQICAGGIGGAVGWQVGALIATCFASVGIGLAISALARSVLQAVMLVPLVLIPQILFSGFTPPAGEMGDGPFWVSRVMPSAAAQSVMDVSLLWGERVTGYTRMDFPAAFSNLNRDGELRNGVVFKRRNPALAGLGVLVAWAVGTYWVAWGALTTRARART